MDNTEVVDVQENHMSFKDKWHAEKLLKQSKKKARKQLQKQGFGIMESRKAVNSAMNRIVDNKPMKRIAGRGG
jgi:type II secretory pathway component PulF